MATLPIPVVRALRHLGQDISSARRTRRLSQEELALRLDVSLSTVRRMEDGHPGTALHTFLRALHLFGRLDALTQVLSLENDTLGLDLIRERLPQRIRTSRKSQTAPPQKNRTGDTSGRDELEGF